MNSQQLQRLRRDILEEIRRQGELTRAHITSENISREGVLGEIRKQGKLTREHITSENHTLRRNLHDDFHRMIREAQVGHFPLVGSCCKFRRTPLTLQSG